MLTSVIPDRHALASWMLGWILYTEYILCVIFLNTIEIYVFLNKLGSTVCYLAHKKDLFDLHWLITFAFSILLVVWKYTFLINIKDNVYY